MPHHAARDPAAQIHLPLIDQAAQAQRHGFFVAGEGALVCSDPGHLAFRDDAADQGLEEDLSDGHESHVTNPLHPGTCPLAAGLGDPLATGERQVLRSFTILHECRQTFRVATTPWTFLCLWSWLPRSLLLALYWGCCAVETSLPLQ